MLPTSILRAPTLLPPAMALRAPVFARNANLNANARMMMAKRWETQDNRGGKSKLVRALSPLRHLALA